MMVVVVIFMLIYYISLDSATGEFKAEGETYQGKIDGSWWCYA